MVLPPRKTRVIIRDSVLVQSHEELNEVFFDQVELPFNLRESSRVALDRLVWRVADLL